MYSTLKNGETTVEEMFFGTVKTATNHDKIADPLSDEPINAQKPSNEQRPNGTSATVEETQNTATGEIIDNTHTDNTASPAGSSVADETPSRLHQQSRRAPSSSGSTLFPIDRAT